MTIANATVRAAYVTDGVSTNYGVPFVFFAATELSVALVSAGGTVVTPLTLNSGYTVTGGNDATGVVVLAAVPPPGQTLLIYRATARTQLTSFAANDAYNAAVLDTQLDRLAATDAELWDALGRTVRAPIQENFISEMPPAAVRAGALLTFDANGNPQASAFSTLLTAALAGQAGGGAGVAAGGGSSSQPGRYLNRQVFATPGSNIYVPTIGTNKVRVWVQAGGGGGGGSANTGASQVSAGAGGGGGGFTEGELTSTFAGVTVTVGAGGLGGAANAAGTAGGSSSFGLVLTATGGAGGSVGPALTANGAPQGSSAAGVGAGGDYAQMGGTGQFAIYQNPATSGKGGFSKFGDGAPWVTGASNGLVAVSPGSGGGGGAQSTPTSTGASGGNGAGGLVIVFEYS